MSLREHCEIRIKNLEEFRDGARDIGLSLERLHFIATNIEVNEKMLKFMDSNPRELFLIPKNMDVLGEVY